MSFEKQVRQKGDAFRNVGEHHQVRHEDEHEGNRLPGDVLHGNTGDVGRHEEIHAHRRGHLPDGKVGDHEHAEEDRIDSQGDDQGVEDGRKERDGRHVIQEGAGDEQRDVDEQEHRFGVPGEGRDHAHELLGNLVRGQEPGENGGGGDEEHDHRAAQSGFIAGRGDAAPGKLPVD